MKFIFFQFMENGENGLGDEGADMGAMPPRYFGLEPPLVINSCQSAATSSVVR